jgi:hypothetical protein
MLSLTAIVFYNLNLHFLYINWYRARSQRVLREGDECIQEIIIVQLLDTHYVKSDHWAW